MKDYTRQLINAVTVATLSSSPLLIGQALAESTVVPTDIRAGFNVSFPSADDNWDGGLGLQAQAIMKTQFLPEPYLMAVSLGLGTWDVNDDTVTLSGSSAASGTLDGDVSVTELGVSVLRKKELPEKIMLTLEAGAVYQINSSDADIVFTYTGSTTPETEELDLDNSFGLLFGADVSSQISDKVTLFVGASYQFDLIEGDATAFDQEIENATGNFKIRTGLEFKY